MENQSSDVGGIHGTLPWTKSCFVCGEQNPHGLHLKSRVEGDRVTLAFKAREADAGWRNTVHGGITTALLDEVMTWASIISFGRACVAAEFTIRLKRPMLPGRAFRAEGRVVKAATRLVIAEGEILDENDVVCATAKGKYVPMPSGQAHGTGEDFVFGQGAIHPDELLAWRGA